MSDRFKFNLDHMEVVQDKKVHYTVTPIANIKEWREERVRVDAEYDVKARERFKIARENAILGVQGDKEVKLIADLESQYIDSRENYQKPSKITWEQIKAKMDNWDEKNNAARQNHYYRVPTITAPVSPKPSLMERLKRFITRISK